MLLFLEHQAWTNCVPNANRVHSGAQNLWDAPDFSGAHILPCQKEKTTLPTGFQSNRWTNEKVTENSKYYHEHQRTCNVLTKFTYLIASKLLYLLMDWETFNLLSSLEQVRGVIRALQTSMIVLLAKIISNVNLKALTIFAKRLILDPWLGQVPTSVDWYIRVLKLKMESF